MKTLTKLSARTLTYYINVRRWKTDLDFFDTEIGFFTQLVDDLASLRSDTGNVGNGQIDDKISALINDKNMVLKLLNIQLKNLECLAEDMFMENEADLTGKQAHLEYQMNDLMHEFREIKKMLFSFTQQITNKQKPLLN